MAAVNKTASAQTKGPRAKSPALLFDLDGTLVDSNYEHVSAWRRALRRAGVEVPNAVLHRFIGMRGDLLILAVYKEIGKTVSHKTVGRLEQFHKTYFAKRCLQ